jgi:hypothetical protein
MFVYYTGRMNRSFYYYHFIYNLICRTRLLSVQAVSAFTSNHIPEKIRGHVPK